jgi:hypothetical protein
VIDNDPIKTDGRKKRIQDRFGNSKPNCVLCGCPDMEALTPVTLGWLKAHGIELHHVVEERRDPDFVVPLCLNCHRKVTEGLARAGISASSAREPRELVAQMLEALAVFFEFLIDALRRWAEILRKSITQEVPNE